MQGTDIILIGGGGHALVVAGSMRDLGLVPVGFLDDSDQAPLARGQGAIPHLGPLCELGTWLEQDRKTIVAIGAIATRRRIIDAFAGLTEAATVIDAHALVRASAEVECGSFIAPGAIVQERATIGRHAIINTGAIVEHECRLGVNVHVAPGAVLGGRVVVGDDALIGLGARVLPNVRIGAASVIGAGAVVTRDVQPAERVAGVPARTI